MHCPIMTGWNSAGVRETGDASSNASKVLHDTDVVPMRDKSMSSSICKDVCLCLWWDKRQRDKVLTMTEVDMILPLELLPCPKTSG